MKEMKPYYRSKDGNFILFHGDCRKELAHMPDKSVQCVITSPPYFQLRNYGVDGEVGLEVSPEEYLASLKTVFKEVWRLLKDDGTVFVNICDSYAGSSLGVGGEGKKRKNIFLHKKRPRVRTSTPPRCLYQIPSRFSIMMTDDLGYILRNRIIWCKPNVTPENVTSRFTVDYEEVFLFSKITTGYKFNQQREEARHPVKTAIPKKPKQRNLLYRKQDMTGNPTTMGFNGRYTPPSDGMRNMRSVWNIPTSGTETGRFKHPAMFPANLIIPMVLSGTDEGDMVLDPFSGAASTGIVANRMARKYIGIETSEEYCDSAIERYGAEAAQGKLDL